MESTPKPDSFDEPTEWLTADSSRRGVWLAGAAFAVALVAGFLPARGDDRAGLDDDVSFAPLLATMHEEWLGVAGIDSTDIGAVTGMDVRVGQLIYERFGRQTWDWLADHYAVIRFDTLDGRRPRFAQRGDGHPVWAGARPFVDLDLVFPADVVDVIEGTADEAQPFRPRRWMVAEQRLPHVLVLAHLVSQPASSSHYSVGGYQVADASDLGELYRFTDMELDTVVILPLRNEWETAFALVAFTRTFLLHSNVLLFPGNDFQWPYPKARKPDAAPPRLIWKAAGWSVASLLLALALVLWGLDASLIVRIVRKYAAFADDPRCSTIHLYLQPTVVRMRLVREWQAKRRAWLRERAEQEREAARAQRLASRAHVPPEPGSYLVEPPRRRLSRKELEEVATRVRERVDLPDVKGETRAQVLAEVARAMEQANASRCERMLAHAESLLDLEE